MAEKNRFGVGMPATLWLEQFGSYVWDAFGGVPYLVGSAITGDKPPRDVDVRLLLEDAQYRAEYGDPDQSHTNAKWVAMTLAFTALAHQMTGLPVDFQIQPREWANEKFKDGPRSALGLVPSRIRVGPAPEDHRE